MPCAQESSVYLAFTQWRNHGVDRCIWNAWFLIGTGCGCEAYKTYLIFDQMVYSVYLLTAVEMWSMWALFGAV
jgi:hypothetical protein